MTRSKTTEDQDNAEISAQIIWCEVRQRAQLIRAANKACLFDALGNAGISVVEMSYAGRDNSGQIERIEARAGEVIRPLPDVEISITDADGFAKEPRSQMMSLADALEVIAYDLLDQTHQGWADDEGAFGDFTFDITARSITLDHDQRVSSTLYYQDVF